MEARILDAVRTRKQGIDKALEVHCIARVGKVRTIVVEYETSALRLPDIREAIIYGTDEEFNTCAEEVTSRLPTKSASRR